MPPKRKLNPFFEDIFYEIFSFINTNIKFKLNCRLVCKQWNNMIMNSSKLWKNDKVYIHHNLHKLPVQLKFILSRIKFSPETTDNDLTHVSQCTQLQLLNLCDCKQITDNGLQLIANLTT